ncbi:uncharacterized protein LOC111459865 isoform X1 [Cucurbita moschata]|uniref:Uncharacterized protein LOC111459865 isoform X1 n=1 Tax=Cucurbita moschata TaxID=3662 RepID=A0A6J1H5Y1_CUCMO|nr:uncharacterized protein LOC111459865 isoform X1 [Cucurbita moschata]
MITLASAYLSSSPSNFSSLNLLRLTKPPFTFSTSLSNLKPLNPSHKSASNQRRTTRNGICRAELGNDAPFAIAIGACILSSLVLPPAGGGSDDDSDAVMDSTDARLAVMGIISFIPYFNWLSWVFAWLDSGKRRYAVYAIVYLAPYLRSNLSLSPDESWLPIVSILICIAHIQVEASIKNGDIQPFQIFGKTSNQISRTKIARGHLKGSQGPTKKSGKKRDMKLPSAEEQLRDEIKGWGDYKETLDHEQSNEEWDDEQRRKR